MTRAQYLAIGWGIGTEMTMLFAMLCSLMAAAEGNPLYLFGTVAGLLNTAVGLWMYVPLHREVLREFADRDASHPWPKITEPDQ